MIFCKVITTRKLFPPGLEPGTFRVLGERDNHYTTETLLYNALLFVLKLQVQGHNTGTGFC